METVIREYTNRNCSRCGGRGFLSVFQYNKCGECFRCGGSGNDPLMIETVRDMSDQEVLDALTKAGYPVIFKERIIDPDNFVLSLFMSDEEVSEYKEIVAGARLFFAAL